MRMTRRTMNDFDRLNTLTYILFTTPEGHSGHQRRSENDLKTSVSWVKYRLSSRKDKYPGATDLSSPQQCTFEEA